MNRAADTVNPNIKSFVVSFLVHCAYTYVEAIIIDRTYI